MIGILGGTFNPIHNGHLHLTQALQAKLNFSAIHFMPAAIPALKDQPLISAAQRAEMVNIAIADHKNFRLDTRELERLGPSYTIDSLISLRQELGNKESICWLIGSDAFAHLNAWKAWQSLLNYCHFVVVKRPHSQDLAHLNTEVHALLSQHQTSNIADLTLATHGKILVAEVAALDISSTQIRAEIAAKKELSGLMPSAVLSYIQQHQLYQQ